MEGACDEEEEKKKEKSATSIYHLMKQFPDKQQLKPDAFNVRLANL